VKYIITESRLHNLALNYLDQMDWWMWDIDDGEFNLSDGKNGKNLISFRVVLDNLDFIYLSHDLATTIAKLFSFYSTYDSVKIIIVWFNKKYNKSLSMKDYEWMDDDDNND
jgi:hypothetical protein